MSNFYSRVTTRYEEHTEKGHAKTAKIESKRRITLEIVDTSYSVGRALEPKHRRKNIKTRVILGNE